MDAGESNQLCDAIFFKSVLVEILKSETVVLLLLVDFSFKLFQTMM